MKIGQPVDKTATPAVEPARTGVASQTKAAPQQAPVVEPESSAKVAISSAASSLISSERKSVNPEFDAEKVAAMTQAIDSGTFKVNAEAIADKLISNAQELLGKVAK